MNAGDNLTVAPGKYSEPKPEPEVTPWFDGSVNPVRVGVYQRDYRDSPKEKYVATYSRWDGSIWYAYTASLENAGITKAISIFQNIPWRGLAADPNA